MSKKLTQKEFEDRVVNYHGNDYTIVGKYCGMYEPIEVVHNVCNHKYIIPRALDLCGNT